jgi:hypothetical protein
MRADCKLRNMRWGWTVIELRVLNFCPLLSVTLECEYLIGVVLVLAICSHIKTNWNPYISDGNHSIRVGEGITTVQPRCSWHHPECWGDVGSETVSSYVKHQHVVSEMVKTFEATCHITKSCKLYNFTYSYYKIYKFSPTQWTWNNQWK